MTLRSTLQSALLFSLLSFCAAAQAISITWIGTWDSTGIGNPTGSGGPGIAAGQKYVVKIEYDPTSSVNTGVDILDASFNPSGQTMDTIDLTGGSNTIDIFVPMTGLDGSTPYIYTQDETTHFPAFIPVPTLNFTAGSDRNNVANIIGVEFEGDFAAGAGNNIIELFNTTAGAATPIEQVGQVLNFGTGIATTDTNGLVDAVDVVAGNGAVTYSAGALTQTSNVNVLQSNDLGAGRSDGEDFLDSNSSWSVSGTDDPDGLNIAVAIQNSGLTSTVDATSWSATITEEMTGKSDVATVLVDYTNTAPTSVLTATAAADGYDFAFSFDDVDLVVNGLIADFEQLTFEVFVDGAATTLFTDLLFNGTQSLSNLALFNAFGDGLHVLQIITTDLAGASASSLARFAVGEEIPPIPVPPAFALFLTAIALFGLKDRLGRRGPQSA